MQNHNRDETSKRFFEVLVVEDEPSIRRIMSMQLKQLGLKVDVAKDGLEAVHCVENRQYDLIFMDVQMPNMSGIQASIAIRNYERQNGLSAVPIIATTAGGATRAECSQAGMTDYLQKPIDLSKLKDVLEKVLCEAG
jgi:CheY-like chemotaxis protein